MTSNLEHKIFEVWPFPALLLLPKAPVFTIVDANEAFLKVTNSHISEIINKDIFDAFPDNPDHSNKSGHIALTKSFDQILSTHLPHQMHVQKYDIPIRGTNKFDIKYWEIQNIPIIENGNVVYILHTALDVTNRELSALGFIEKESEFQSREMRFKNIFDYSGAGIAMQDLNGKWMEINETVTLITGYSKSELSSKTFRDITYQDDIESDMQRLNNLRNGVAKSYEWEKRYVHKNGNIIWILITVSTVSTDNSKPLYFITHFIDISEKKESERALRESEQKYQSLFYFNPDAVFSFNREGIFLSANQATADLTGYSIEELLNHSYEKLIIKEELKKVQKIFRLALKGVPQNYNTIIITASGKKVIINVTKLPIKIDNKIAGLYGIAKDITAQINSHESIRQSNERFEKVAEATNDAIWDWDMVNDIIYWGKGFEKLFGYKVAKQWPRKSWSMHIHPDDIQDVERSVKEAYENEDVLHWENDYRFKKADGTYAFVNDRGSLIRDENKKAVRMVGSMSDISHRKEYEESLKKLNADLATLNNELAISNKELEQFAYIASHDLQEPLRMITSFLSLIEQKYEPSIDEKGKKYFSFVKDGANRMKQIILDLLEFSIIGKSDMQLEVVDVNEMISHILSVYQNQIKESNAVVSVDLIPSIVIYRTPLNQVFDNLISNALKYRKKDIPPLITISYKELSEHWQFSISDNGIGIDPKFFDKIFIIFQRLHNRQEYSGTGIGLAIVKKTIETLGGNISIESDVEKGSLFTFTVKKYFLNSN